jgi:hypothetical protein
MKNESKSEVEIECLPIYWLIDWFTNWQYIFVGKRVCFGRKARRQKKTQQRRKKVYR